MELTAHEGSSRCTSASGHATRGPLSGNKCTKVTVRNGSSVSLLSSSPRLRLGHTVEPGRNQMQKHVALYARVSSDRQVEEGTIESQLASLQT
jgi:hypothetical protein